MRKGWERVNSVFYRRTDGRARILLDTAKITDPDYDWLDKWVPAVVGDFVRGEVEHQLVIPVMNGSTGRVLGKLMRLLDEEIGLTRPGRIVRGQWNARKVKALERTHGVKVPLGCK